MSDEVNIEEQDIIKTVISYLPFLTVLAIAYGVFYEVCYYFPFSINIFEYLEFNEIVLNALNALGFILPISIITIIINYNLIQKPFDKKVNAIEDKQKRLEFLEVEITKSKKSTGIGKFTFWVFCPLIFLIQFIPDLINSTFNIIDYEILAFLILTLVINFFVIDYLKQFYKTFTERRLDNKSFFLIVILVVTISVGIYLGLYKSKTLIDNSNIGTYIVIEKDTIKSIPNHYYIGRTKNYVFFYNGLNKHTDVYQNKDIKLISIK